MQLLSRMCKWLKLSTRCDACGCFSPVRVQRLRMCVCIICAPLQLPLARMTAAEQMLFTQPLILELLYNQVLPEYVRHVGVAASKFFVINLAAILVKRIARMWCGVVSLLFYLGWPWCSRQLC